MATVVMHSHKSTNGRTLSPTWPLVFGWLERTSPSLAGAWAERLFFRPPASRLSASQRDLLRSGRRIEQRLAGRRILGWQWGDGAPVLLVHGWGSRAAHFMHWIPALLGAGYSPISLDAPAHGESEGRQTSMPEFAAALDALDRSLGRPRWAGIVAHSLGGPAATLALRNGLRAARGVFLAPGTGPTLYTQRFAQALGIGQRSLSALRSRAERRLGWRFADLEVSRLAPSSRWPLLVVHDEQDAEVPWQEGRSFVEAWPGASLELTRGLGHRRILRDAGVISRSLAFLQGEAAHSEPVVRAGGAGWLHRSS